MISINDHYKNKYLKYKNKYFNLINKKNNQKGGSTEMYVLTSISLIVGLLLASLHSNNFFKYFNRGDDLQNKEYIIINKSKKPLIDTAKQPQNLSFKNIETFLDTGHTQSLPESVPLQPKIAEKDTVKTPVEINSSIVDTGLNVNEDYDETDTETDTETDDETDDETDAETDDETDSVKLPTEAIKAKNEGQLKFTDMFSSKDIHIIDINIGDTILDARKKLEEKINAKTNIYYSGRKVTDFTDINKMLTERDTSIMYKNETNNSQSQGNTDEKKKEDLQAVDGVSAADNRDDNDTSDDNDTTDVTNDSDDNNDVASVSTANGDSDTATGDDAAHVSANASAPATGVDAASGPGDDAAPATDVDPVLATDAAAAESNIIVSKEVERVNERKKFLDEVNDKLREHQI